jgi:DNA-directed RNA polymerase subunit RPC12/RpoP
MFDIRKMEIKMKCSTCGSMVKTTLEQVADEEKVKCTCGKEIQLIDFDGINKKIIEENREEYEIV